MELIKLDVKPLNVLLIEDNYDIVETRVKEVANKYKSLKFNDLEIAEAKRIVAELNKMQKEANDLKIEIKKEVSKPIVDFEEKVKKLIAIIEEPKEEIKKQVEDFVERSKALKKQMILGSFNELKGDLPINFDLIFDEKWLNASEKEKLILERLNNIVNDFRSDYEIIKNIDSDFKIQIEDIFLKTLSLNQALQEQKRLEGIKKRKFEEEQEKIKRQTNLEKELNLQKDETINVSTGEIVQKEKEYSFILKITATFEKKEKLKDFLKNNFIKYEL